MTTRLFHSIRGVDRRGLSTRFRISGVKCSPFARQVSGLSREIGKLFVSFRDFPAWLLALLLSALTATFTEVTSNIATATIFLPIIAELV